MVLTDSLSQSPPFSQRFAVSYATEAVAFVFVSGLLYYLVPYLRDSQGIRRCPGPWLAKFSCLWFSREILEGRVQTSLKRLHEQYGTFVRIGPDSVSICSPDALQTIYAHSSNALKSSLYDAFAPFGAARSIFDTTSREDHARKRKVLSHILAAKSLQEVIPIIYTHQKLFVKHWDDMCVSAAKGDEGEKGDCKWEAKDGRAWFNAMPWFNYIAFDVIGDLAFGAPFGMLPAVKAETLVAQSAEQAMDTFVSKGSDSIKYRTINAVKTINASNAFATFIGSLPKWARPYIMNSPTFKRELGSRKALGAMAVTAVSRRLNNTQPILRRDFLAKLLDARDGHGHPLGKQGKQELVSEALSLLVGGSDTTANSSAALVYYLAQNPFYRRKLQVALDTVLGPPDFSLSSEDAINEDSLTKLKECEYLNNVINEGLRLHSTAGFGLPRVVPEGGMVVCGEVLKEGTVVSTPGFALHRMKEVWGEDADTFNPERWERENRVEMYRAFSPFSIGPRACLGRYLAQIELQVFIGTIFHRYDVALASRDQKMHVHAGFIRKPENVYILFNTKRVALAPPRSTRRDWVRQTRLSIGG